MKHIIQQILREQLSSVLQKLNEEDYKGAITNTADADQMIYNYNEGSAFAANTLQVDISGLEQYELQDYLPTSEKSEQWTFKFEGNFGVLYMVDVIKKVKNNGTFWSMIFGSIHKDEKEPQILADLYSIKGYEKFVESCNQYMGDKINPSDMGFGKKL